MPEPELTRDEVEQIVRAIEWAMRQSPYGSVNVIYRECRILDIIPAPRIRIERGKDEKV